MWIMGGQVIGNPAIIIYEGLGVIIPVDRHCQGVADKHAEKRTSEAICCCNGVMHVNYQGSAKLISLEQKQSFID